MRAIDRVAKKLLRQGMSYSENQSLADLEFRILWFVSLWNNPARRGNRALWGSMRKWGVEQLTGPWGKPETARQAHERSAQNDLENYASMAGLTLEEANEKILHMWSGWCGAK